MTAWSTEIFGSVGQTSPSTSSWSGVPQAAAIAVSPACSAGCWRASSARKTSTRQTNMLAFHR